MSIRTKLNPLGGIKSRKKFEDSCFHDFENLTQNGWNINYSSISAPAGGYLLKYMGSGMRCWWGNNSVSYTHGITETISRSIRNARKKTKISFDFYHNWSKSEFTGTGYLAFKSFADNILSTGATNTGLGLYVGVNGYNIDISLQNEVTNISNIVSFAKGNWVSAEFEIDAVSNTVSGYVWLSSGIKPATPNLIQSAGFASNSDVDKIILTTITQGYRGKLGADSGEWVVRNILITY